MGAGVLTGDRINEVFFYSDRITEVAVRRVSTVYRMIDIDGNLGLYLRWKIKTVFIQPKVKTLTFLDWLNKLR